MGMRIESRIPTKSVENGDYMCEDVEKKNTDMFQTCILESTP